MGLAGGQDKTEKALEATVEVSRELYKRVQALDEGRDIAPFNHTSVRKIRTNLLLKAAEHRRDHGRGHDIYDSNKVREVVTAIDILDRYLGRKLKKSEMCYLGEARMTVASFNDNPRKYVSWDLSDEVTSAHAA